MENFQFFEDKKTNDNENEIRTDNQENNNEGNSVHHNSNFENFERHDGTDIKEDNFFSFEEPIVVEKKENFAKEVDQILSQINN